MSSNMHKSAVSFPKAQQDFRPGHSEEPSTYLDYLLELADRFFRGKLDREDERPS